MSSFLLLDSRKHGISASELAIRTEDIEEFNQFLAGLFEDMRPNGETQRTYFGQILHGAWNMRIARKHESQILLESGPASKALDSITRFYLRNERTFQRAIRELRDLQTEFAYRATLAHTNDTGLPDVPPLVRTALVNRQVRSTVNAAARAATQLRNTSLSFAPVQRSS